MALYKLFTERYNVCPERESMKLNELFGAGDKLLLSIENVLCAFPFVVYLVFCVSLDNLMVF